jgi:hypothetical protein
MKTFLLGLMLVPLLACSCASTRSTATTANSTGVATEQTSTAKTTKEVQVKSSQGNKANAVSPHPTAAE